MFSEEYGLEKKKLQINSVSQSLRNRIWNYYYENETNQIGAVWNKTKMTIRGVMSIDKKIGDRLGFNIQDFNLIKKLESYVKGPFYWYTPYDFIDLYLEYVENDRDKKASDLNKVLQEECSAYRIVNYKVTPITSETEIDEIQKATQSPYESVNTHTKKALDYLSSRTNPDYENSIKESISAVESMCCVITGETGKNATLNKTIKKLKDKGVHIHGAMESAFISLYGYTSDESGVRHGGKDTAEVTFEDAKFMLVSCAAFVNYLIAKWEKVK